MDYFRTNIISWKISNFYVGSYFIVLLFSQHNFLLWTRCWRQRFVVYLGRSTMLRGCLQRSSINSPSIDRRKTRGDSSRPAYWFVPQSEKNIQHMCVCVYECQQWSNLRTANMNISHTRRQMEPCVRDGGCFCAIFDRPCPPSRSVVMVFRELMV